MPPKTHAHTSAFNPVSPWKEVLFRCKNPVSQLSSNSLMGQEQMTIHSNTLSLRALLCSLSIIPHVLADLTLNVGHRLHNHLVITTE